MKKIVALVLSLVMVLGLATTAFAVADTFDLYQADSGMATAMKTPNGMDFAGYEIDEVGAKSYTDGSGNVAYMVFTKTGAATRYGVKTTAPTTTSYAVTAAGKTDVLYYVDLAVAGTAAGNYEYSDTCDVAGAFGYKCGEVAPNVATFVANPLATYFVLDDDVTVCESKASVADKQYNFLVGDKVYSGTIVGKVVDHSFTANDFDYNATLKANVPTSAICTKCLMVSTSIYLDGKVPAGKAFYDITNAAAYSVVAEDAAVVAPEAGDKVESAETFDAGIAMYVGMSVMAAAGSAVVLKKKD